MATLHVRNVPDDVYEALRTRAEANGRSISAEAVQLLEHQLATELAQRPGWLRRPRRRGGGLFTRFTEEARAVVVAAQEEARALGHDHVGSGHLLAALLAADEGAAADALRSVGLTLERARAELGARVPAAEAPPGRLPFAPDAKKALELALREALVLGHGSIGGEHVLLGIVRGGDGVGAEIVRLVEPDADAVRGAVVRTLASAGAPAPPSRMPPPPFRVVELEGSAAEWETRLNEAAAEGFELVELAGGRAIFRCDA